jgi:hypothetical protein
MPGQSLYSLLMIVMPSNNSGFEAGVLYARYPERIAHLHSADSIRQPTHEISWALDNGVFGAYHNGRPWKPEPLMEFLDRYGLWSPLWVVVPDWIGDREETLRRWKDYAPRLKSYGHPLAMAVQDGMTPKDVPHDADIIFVGGTTAWKWKTLRTWCGNFPRVHVGRVNTYKLLWQAHECGAESCDGTGWFRGDRKQLDGLRRYLDESDGDGPPQMELIEA